MTTAPTRILVVEDESLGSGLLAVLARAGHEVRWAQSAAAARELIAGGAPDLILLDLGPPTRTGWCCAGRSGWRFPTSSLSS